MSCLKKEKKSDVNDTSQQAKKQALSAVDLTNAVLVNFYGEGKTAINMGIGLTCGLWNQHLKV